MQKADLEMDKQLNAFLTFKSQFLWKKLYKKFININFCLYIFHKVFKNDKQAISVMDESDCNSLVTWVAWVS